MNRNPVITCAVTGSGDTAGKHPDLPKSPAEIATAAIEAARAGAAIAHIHVREPGTGKPCRDVELYREVVDRIRENDTDVVINLTTGMGGDLYLGPDDDPLSFTDETDCVGQMERMAHVEALLPEICSLDCGVQHIPYDQRPLKLTFGDLTEMTREEKQLFVDVYDRFGVPINWNVGDVAVVCNWRWAHGRPGIHLDAGEERELGVVIGAPFERIGDITGKW